MGLVKVSDGNYMTTDRINTMFVRHNEHLRRYEVWINADTVWSVPITDGHDQDEAYMAALNYAAMLADRINAASFKTKLNVTFNGPIHHEGASQPAVVVGARSNNA